MFLECSQPRWMAARECSLFPLADKQIFIALVERYHFVVAGPLVRINDEKNRMDEIFGQRPGPFDVVVDGLGDLMAARGIDYP